jgi:folylpolyglutamate synthase
MYCSSGRSGSAFLGTVASQLAFYNCAAEEQQLFDHVIFCAISTHANGGYWKGATSLSFSFFFCQLIRDNLGLWLDSTVDPNLQDDRDSESRTMPRELAAAWSWLMPGFPADHIHVLPSIDRAVQLVRSMESADRIGVLVTGSLYIVGGLIKVAGLVDVAM